MRIVQMTLDENLVKAVDQEAKKLHTTRSGFARTALQAAIKRIRDLEKDRRYREGYRKHPPAPDEFSVWESEQVWGD